MDELTFIIWREGRVVERWRGQARPLVRRLGPARFGSYELFVRSRIRHEHHVHLATSAGVIDVTGCSLHFLDTAQEPVPSIAAQHSSKKIAACDKLADWPKETNLGAIKQVVQKI